MAEAIEAVIEITSTTHDVLRICEVVRRAIFSSGNSL